MILREKIFKENKEGEFDADIIYNEEIAKGLYAVGLDRDIKINMKKLGINFQVPREKGEAGTRFSRHPNLVVATILIIAENTKRHKMQFLIKPSCTKKAINECQHYVISGLTDVLKMGVEMTKVYSMEDLAKWQEKIAKK